MRPTKEDRMVIAYIPKELHKKIRKYCIDKDITLVKWTELAHKKLSPKD